MIDLLKYGFIAVKKTPNYTEYNKEGLRITIYEYAYRGVKDEELHRYTFVVNTKQTTSMPIPLSDLEKWLKKKNINPI